MSSCGFSGLMHQTGVYTNISPSSEESFYSAARSGVPRREMRVRVSSPRSRPLGNQGASMEFD